jgi:steroid 5-alpha reductase family enzyme
MNSALYSVILIAVGFCAFAWIASLLTGDTSWVDRGWSIVPAVYVWVFAASAGLHNSRLNLMAIIVTLWAVRLTFNFARKGGYTGVEDYRWQVLRDSMTKWQFQLFNIFFIVVYQNFILVLIALPALTAYEHQGNRLTGLDIALASLFLLFLLGETIADQQQWNFHKGKHKAIAEGRKPEANFMTTGLFAISRHPNYFCEVAQWWVLFLIGARAAGGLGQWTIAGSVLLTILFMGSTNFTEKITLSKYPEYAQYQRSTAAVIPFLKFRR